MYIIILYVSLFDNYKEQRKKHIYKDIFKFHKRRERVELLNLIGIVWFYYDILQRNCDSSV